MASFPYVVLGGGNASGYVAHKFVKNGLAAGQLCIITEEPHVAYERPALSKGFLAPQNPARLPNFHTCVGMSLERQDLDWYRARGIEYKTNTKVTKVDVVKKSLETEAGESVEYDKLIVATGARPVYLSEFKMPGADLKGVYYLRNVIDAELLFKAFQEGRREFQRVVVIGGGYIGMECAAAVAIFGLRVSMVYPEKRLMERLFTPELSEFYEDNYTRRGIYQHKETLVTELEGEEGKVKNVVLNNGEKLPADFVVVGVGARPNKELFDGQLEMEAGGIKVNTKMQTSNPDVYAIGDVAAFPLIRYDGKVQRQEHVANCRQSAFHAVDAITSPDTTEDYNYLPFFYSRVFGFSWQFYGINKGEVVNFGEQSTGTFGCYWVDEGKVVGAFLEGGSDAQNKAIKAVAMARPPAPEDLEEQGIVFAISMVDEVTS